MQTRFATIHKHFIYSESKVSSIFVPYSTSVVIYKSRHRNPDNT